MSEVDVGGTTWPEFGSDVTCAAPAMALRSVRSGRVRFTRAAGRRRSGATSPLGSRWGEVGEVSHFGSLGEPHA